MLAKIHLKVYNGIVELISNMRYRITLELSSRLLGIKGEEKKEIEKTIKKLPRYSSEDVGNELNKTYYDERGNYFFFDIEMDYSITPECTLHKDIFPSDYPNVWETTGALPFHEPTLVIVRSRFIDIDIS